MRLLLLGAALLLAACATPYVRDNGYGGYQDGPVEGNLHRVIYTAPGGMDLRETRDLALYRAAQVCREQGAAVFVVVRQTQGTAKRLQLAPPEPPAYYDIPVAEPGPGGPRVVWVPEPAWGSGFPQSYAVPAPYTELYVRTYARRADAPAKEAAHDAAEILARIGAQYKLSP